jgi:hypothetical protein
VAASVAMAVAVAVAVAVAHEPIRDDGTLVR